MKKGLITAFAALFVIVTATAQSTQKEPNYKLIIGKWQSANDKKEVWIFNDKYLTITYADSTVFDNKYGINDRCQNDQDTPIPESEKYITTYEGNCYYIIKLSAKEMELSFVGRGNTLRFVRKN